MRYVPNHCWTNVKFDLTRGKIIGVNQPTWEQMATDGAGSNGVYAYNFDNGDEIWFAVTLPVNYIAGTTIYPELHWTPESDVDPSENIGIGLEYWWANEDDDFSGNTTIITRDVPTGVNSQWQHLHHEFDTNGISGVGKKPHSMFVCRFFRQAAGANDYGDGIFALMVDMHVRVKADGNRTRENE